VAEEGQQCLITLTPGGISYNDFGEPNSGVNSAEIFTENGWRNLTITLPVNIYEHCFVLINETTAMLIGRPREQWTKFEGDISKFERDSYTAYNVKCVRDNCTAYYKNNRENSIVSFYYDIEEGIWQKGPQLIEEGYSDACQRKNVSFFVSHMKAI